MYYTITSIFKTKYIIQSYFVQLNEIQSPHYLSVSIHRTLVKATVSKRLSLVCARIANVFLSFSETDEMVRLFLVEKTTK